MGQAGTRIKKEVQRKLKFDNRIFFNALCDLPLKERIKATTRIIFRRRYKIRRVK